MKWHVYPSKLQGSIEIPPSKSETHRAFLFALLADGTSRIERFLDSPDTRAMLNAIQALGARVKRRGSSLEIIGVGGKLQPSDRVIDAGNSGIVLRFIAAIAALHPSYTVITGDDSIRSSVYT